jgi:hypothetical protein
MVLTSTEPGRHRMDDIGIVEDVQALLKQSIYKWDYSGHHGSMLVKSWYNSGTLLDVLWLREISAIRF